MSLLLFLSFLPESSAPALLLYTIGGVSMGVIDRLGSRERMFCNEYIISYNGTEAYRKAYGERSRSKCSDNARYLLRRREIQEYIRELQTERNNRLQIQQDDVLREIGLIAFSRASDLLSIDDNGNVVCRPTSELDLSQLAAIASIRQERNGVSIRMFDKLKALELYAKVAGWLAEKQDITATVTYEQFLSRLDGDYNYD